MYCYFKTLTGVKRIDVDIRPDPNDPSIFLVKFPYFKPMVDLCKELDKPSNCFDPDTKTWRIKNNRRNIFALNLVTTREMVEKFTRPLSLGKIPGNWEHQNAMFNAIMTRKTCIIAGEMRTGKTKPTLDAIVASKCDRAWIVSTVAALHGVRREVSKWGIDKAVIIRYYTYDGFRRYIQELNESRTIYDRVTKENIPQFVVFDEMQKLKTPTAQVTEAALLLSDWMYELYGWDNYYLVGLSGTPAPKNPGDWWSLVEIICPGFIKECNRGRFERRLGEFVRDTSIIGQEFWRFQHWKQEELEALYRRLKPIVFVYLKKDCLDLPPIQYEVVRLKPSEDMLRTAKLIVQNDTNALSVRNKLRQLSDGFVYKKEYNEELNKETRTGIEFVGSPKIDQLKQDLDEYEDVGRIIIYACFDGSIEIITNICVEKGWVVLQITGNGWKVIVPQDWRITSGLGKNPSVDLCLSEMDRSTNKYWIDKLAVVANPEAGGEGNEFSAAPVIIYYSNPDKGAARMQSEARAHSNNMDKQRGLLVKDYCHLPTDYKIRKTLMQKKDLQALTLGDFSIALQQDTEEVCE